MRRLPLIVLLAAGISTSAHEDPKPQCVAPSRPDESVPEHRWREFKQGLHDYRECMSAFIASHHEAAGRHRNAANAATERWNQFVQAELNVPEDFPWPPAQTE